MAKNLLLIKLPEPRVLQMMRPVFEIEVDSTGATIFEEDGETPKLKLDKDKNPIPVMENGFPKQVIERVDYASPVRGLAAALQATTSELLKAGHDFFDVQDTRKKIMEAFDKRGRTNLDDRYLIVTEVQSKILIEAARKHDWMMKIRTANGVEQDFTLWLDWFEFFDAIRSPIAYDFEKPDAGYATWLIEKTKRVSEEAEAEKAALEAAAGGENNG